MPPISSLISNQEEISLEKAAIPLYGKPNHSFKWKFSLIERKYVNLIAYAKLKYGVSNEVLSIYFEFLIDN